MTSFLLFSEQPLVRAFGWSLLHFVWEGAVVAILLAAVLKLLHAQSPQLRYTVACCALVLMTILPLITSGYLAITSHVMDHAVTYSIAEKSPAMALHRSFSGAADSWLHQIAASLDHSLAWITAAWFAGVVLLLGRLNIGLIVVNPNRSMRFTPLRSHYS